jgi:hypothetical protein
MSDVVQASVEATLVELPIAVLCFGWRRTSRTPSRSRARFFKQRDPWSKETVSFRQNELTRDRLVFLRQLRGVIYLGARG